MPDSEDSGARKEATQRRHGVKACGGYGEESNRLRFAWSAAGAAPEVDASQPAGQVQ